MIPAVLLTFSIITMSSSSSPSVTEVPEVVRPGYETTPASYTVTASMSKCFHDANALPLAIAGLLIAVLVTFFYVLEAENMWSPGPAVLTVAWLIGLLLIFAPTAQKKTSSSYTSSLSKMEYELNKDRIDSLFPKVESVEK